MSHSASTNMLLICTAVLLCACTPSSQRAKTPLIAPSDTNASTNDHASAEASTTAAAPDSQPQATSLLGQPLYPPPLAPDIRAKREQQLYEAQIVYDRDPHDEGAIIWLGRRQAYLGEYRAAIDTFSNGLAIDPDSPKLLRHRGHRFITVRQFDDAIADLQRAADIIERNDITDEVEPDGQPNARNIPTSTSHTNIYYHLGLALYLQGEFADAANAWRKCLDLARNDDMRVAATYWLYLALMRSGQTQQARDAIEPIAASMDIIENTSYHQLILVFKGELDEDALIAGDAGGGVGGDASIDIATANYGLGVRDLLNGDAAAANAKFRIVIEQTNWAAFGHIAAEAELAANREPPTPSSRAMPSP